MGDVGVTDVPTLSNAARARYRAEDSLRGRPL
jgi:hypothetical protein